ncbi:MAG TPA: hypothetical protein PLX89_25125 [Verrucomicrobiota bacterium]|nr:hypothetical protein [Verrucomicrobiota bacterium]
MRISALIFAAVALLLVGCVATDLRVTNRTGTVIHVYSGHTKKIATIAADATVTVPHTSGRIIVITGRDEVWEYDDVWSLVDEATQSYKRVSLHVSIGSDGSIALPSGGTLTPTRRLTR